MINYSVDRPLHNLHGFSDGKLLCLPKYLVCDYCEILYQENNVVFGNLFQYIKKCGLISKQDLSLKAKRSSFVNFIIFY
jgi:hypothetical protein